MYKILLTILFLIYQSSAFASSSSYLFNGTVNPLGLIAGTYTDGKVCSYTSSGTVLNCTTTVSGSNTGDQDLSGYLTTANASSTYVPQTTTVNAHALSGNVSVTASDVGLGNVTNTSDANKPVSTAQQTALDLKANIASPTFTGTVGGVTKAMVGLGSVVNSDTTTTANITDSTNKRFITDAQQTVLGNTSGTNSGDQTTVSGNAGTVTTVTATNLDNVFSTTGLLKRTGAATYSTDTSTYLTSYTETDPKVGTVTNGNFCKGTGTQASCTDSSTYLSTVTADSPLSGSGTSGSHLFISTAGTWAGNAVTATTATSAGTVTGFSPTAGKTLSVSKTMTLTAADDTGVYTFPTGTATLLATNGSAASLTSFPTLNQNTTGSSAKWTTAKNLAGNSIDGSADVAFANKFIVQGTTDTGLSAAQFLGALGTGIVKNTTTTGVLSIAVAGDFPTLNQSTTGSAATLTTPRTIGGVSFDGSANITISSATGAFTVTNLLTANGSISTAGSTTVTLGGTGGLTITDTKAAGTCTSSAATTCTATVRSGCKPVCSQSTSVSTTIRCAVSTTTLTCTFGTSGTNTCNFVCF